MTRLVEQYAEWLSENMSGSKEMATAARGRARSGQAGEQKPRDPDRPDHGKLKLSHLSAKTKAHLMKAFNAHEESGGEAIDEFDVHLTNAAKAHEETIRAGRRTVARPHKQFDSLPRQSREHLVAALGLHRQGGDDIGGEHHTNALKHCDAAVAAAKRQNR